MKKTEVLETEEIVEQENGGNEKAKKNKSALIIVAVAICVAAAIAAFVVCFMIPNGKYNDGIVLMNNGKYTEAIAKFKEVSGYKDADQKVMQSLYLQATELQNNKEYEAAIEVFESVKNYKDSGDKIIECQNVLLNNKYTKAVSLMKAKKYAEALEIFEELDGYKKSASKATTCIKTLAKKCASKGDVDGAISWYTKCDDKAAVKKVKYDYVLKHKNNKDTKTYEFLKELKLDKYKDSAKIYKDLYSKITVDLFFNTDYSDEKTRLTTLKINKGYVTTDTYYHYEVKGGYPGQIIKLKIVNEDRDIRDYYDIGWYSSERGEEVKAADGVQAYPLGVYTGKCYRVTIYNSETGEKLVSKTLTVPENY